MAYPRFDNFGAVPRTVAPKKKHYNPFSGVDDVQQPAPEPEMPEQDDLGMGTVSIDPVQADTPPKAAQAAPPPQAPLPPAGLAALKTLMGRPHASSGDDQVLKDLTADYQTMRKPLVDPEVQRSANIGSVVATGLGSMLRGSPSVFYNNGRTYNIGPSSQDKEAMANGWQQMMQAPITQAMRDREKTKGDFEMGSKLEDLSSKIEDRKYLNQERDIQAQQRQSALDRIRQERDASSEFSRQRVAQFSDSAARAAEFLDKFDARDGTPSPLANMFRKAAQWATSAPRSAEEIKQMEADNKALFDMRDKIEQRNVARETAQGLQGYRDATLDATRAQQQATNNLAWSNYRTHADDLAHKAQVDDEKLKIERERLAAQKEKDAQKAAELRLSGPEAKINERVTELITKTKLAKEALKAKKKANTGPLIGRIQGGLEDYTGDLFVSDDFINAGFHNAKVTNEIIKDNTGKGVTKEDTARLAAETTSMKTDDKAYETKMGNIIKILTDRLAKTVEEYQELPGGKFSDRSGTAKKAQALDAAVKAGKSPAQAFDEVYGPNASKAPAQPAAPVSPKQIEAARRVLSSPESSPEMKAMAQKVIDRAGGK